MLKYILAVALLAFPSASMARVMCIKPDAVQTFKTEVEKMGESALVKGRVVAAPKKDLAAEAWQSTIVEFAQLKDTNPGPHMVFDVMIEMQPLAHAYEGRFVSDGMRMGQERISVGLNCLNWGCGDFPENLFDFEKEQTFLLKRMDDGDSWMMDYGGCTSADFEPMSPSDVLDNEIWKQ